MSIDRLFLTFSINKLEQLTSRIEDCLERLNEDQIWARGSDAENAIGNLVLHLSGNVRQWIISAVGGQPDVRNRDREFAARGDIPPADLKARLHTTVVEAIRVLGVLSPERLTDRVLVQKYDVTVLEAVYHVVEHFSMHTGQILFVTKSLTKTDLGYYRNLSDPGHAEKTP